MNNNCFTFGITESIGQTVIAPTLTAARYTVYAWNWYTATFFSQAASQQYATIGRKVARVAAITILIGVMARLIIQGWVDNQVNQSLPTEQSLLEPVKETKLLMPTELPIEVVEPVSILSEVIEVKPPTIRQLKELASAAKVKGYGRMNKVQLMEVLAV